MNIPYGVASFTQLRERGYLYVDKTRYIPLLESKEKGRVYLLFLRPRRFGKSLWISVLEHYYSLLHKDQFDRLFDGLYIAEHPTPEKSQYLIFRLEFTGIDPNQALERIQEEMLQLVRSNVRRFCREIAALVPGIVGLEAELKTFTSPARLMKELLDVLSGSPYKLYVLIDEYDNFTNALISLGREDIYRALTRESGFIREFYKALKEGSSRGLIARMFITGVSPVTMDDITSGANIFKQVSLDGDLNAMTGFTHEETRAMLETHFRDLGMTLPVGEAFEEMVRFYDGYRFSEDATERVFNPDMVLYYLSSLRPPNQPPRQLIDDNVRIDLTRLRSLLYEGEVLRPSAVKRIQHIIEEGKANALVRPLFPLEQVYQLDGMTSLLYYLGLLSLPAENGPHSELVIPNYVARTLYWEALHTLLEQAHRIERSTELEERVITMGRTGDLTPVMEYIFPLLVQMCSNRDLIELSEKNLKFMVLPYFMMCNAYLPWSEVELNHGYSDLLLIPTPSHTGRPLSIMLELKYIKLSVESVRYDKEGVKHTKVKPLTRDARAKAVVQAFEEGEAQLARYRADARLMSLGSGAGWCGYTVVFEGLESVHFRAPGQPKRKLLAPKG